MSKLSVKKARDKIDTNGNYGLDRATSVLGKMHPYFDRNATSRVIRNLGSYGSIGGKDIVRVVSEMNGMMLTRSTTTLKKLVRETGYDEGKIGSFMKGGEMRELLHSVPDSSGVEYFLRSDIPKLRLRLIGKFGDNRIYANKVEENNPARADIRESYMEKEKQEVEINTLADKLLKDCEKLGIMPLGKVYQSLKRSGVLNYESVETVKSSFKRYMDEMEGYRFRDFNRLRERLGVNWDQFREVLQPFIVKGDVKDIGLLGNGRSSVYTVARGKGKEIDIYFNSLVKKKNTDNGSRENGKTA